MIRPAAISAAALLAAMPAAAELLRLPPTADRQAHRVQEGDSHFLPTAPVRGDRAAGITAEGRVEQIAWTVGDGSLSTLDLIAPLRDQLIAGGFEPIFECDTDACGGFDFRYWIDVLPEPGMHVNLGDFRYFSGRRGDGAEYVSLLVSRTARTGFVQLTRIGPPEATGTVTASTKTPATDAPVIAAPAGTLADTLEASGHATLDDLVFETGSSRLGTGNFASLAALARYLKANPDRRVMLVGHTDAAGALDMNIALSRSRAGAVRTRLIDRYGVDEGQVQADGIGFLAPRASNLTEEGRMQNRRVEVILTSTQ